MKTEDGTILQEEDYIALYPCINVKHKNYEIWQHPYIKGAVLEDAWSNETHVYFSKIIKRKEQASNETIRINQK